MTNLLSNSDKKLFVSHGDFTMGDNGLFCKTRKADSNGSQKHITNLYQHRLKY